MTAHIANDPKQHREGLVRLWCCLVAMVGTRAERKSAMSRRAIGKVGNA